MARRVAMKTSNQPGARATGFLDGTLACAAGWFSQTGRTAMLMVCFRPSVKTVILSALW